MGTLVRVSTEHKRILNLQEAAGYVGYGTEKFKAHCPVGPIKMPCGKLKYDIEDLDAWIEKIKKNSAPSVEDAFLERLTGHD